MSKKKPTPSRPMIEVLQEELATRRQEVERCRAKHEALVRASGDALAAAQAEVDEYVGKIAEALGLPNPLAREKKRLETRRLRKMLRQLSDDGKLEGRTPEQVAAEVGGDLEAVTAIMRSLCRGEEDDSADAGDGKGEGDGDGRNFKIQAGRRGWKRERVRVLYLEGMTRGEIAAELDISKDCVNSHLSALRREGKIDEVDSSGGGEGAGEADEGEDLDDDDGDSVSDLRDEVARQQGGSRTIKARLPTCESADHSHVASVDRLGDGVTEPDFTGHQHLVHRFVLGKIKDHQHGLFAKAP